MNEPQSIQLEIHNLAYQYPGSDWTLHVDRFKIAAGDLKAVIGPNGSGKSTFLKLMAGIIRSTDGGPILNGNPMKKMKRKEIAKSIGYLPQYLPSDYNYRVSELISMGRYPHMKGSNMLDQHDCSVIQHCMEITDTVPLADRRVFQLSGGERQRVFLASVLAQEPSILLFDEPTNALDIHHQVEFINIIHELNQKGIAMLLVTHDVNLASTVCSSIVLLNQGNVILEGSPDEVLHPRVLKPVYGDELYFTQHPLMNRPWVLPKFSEQRM